MLKQRQHLRAGLGLDDKHLSLPSLHTSSGGQRLKDDIRHRRPSVEATIVERGIERLQSPGPMMLSSSKPQSPTSHESQSLSLGDAQRSSSVPTLHGVTHSVWRSRTSLMESAASAASRTTPLEMSLDGGRSTELSQHTFLTAIEEENEGEGDRMVAVRRSRAAMQTSSPTASVARYRGGHHHSSFPSLPRLTPKSSHTRSRGALLRPVPLDGAMRTDTADKAPPQPAKVSFAPFVTYTGNDPEALATMSREMEGILTRLQQLEGSVQNLSSGEGGGMTPRSKLAQLSVQRMDRVVNRLQRVFSMDFDDGSSEYRRRVFAALKVVATLRARVAQRKYRRMKEALARYRRRHLVSFGHCVMEWLRCRNEQDEAIRRWHQICCNRALQKCFKAWKEECMSSFRDPRVYVAYAKFVERRENAVRRRVFTTLKIYSKSLGLRTRVTEFKGRKGIITPIDKLANYANPSIQLFKPMSARHKLIRMSAHLVSAKNRLMRLKYHFTAWHRLHSSRVLLRETPDSRELKEKAFLCWSLFIKQRQNARQFRRKWDSQMLRRLFPQLKAVAHREFLLVQLSLEKWLNYSYSLRSLPFKALYVYARRRRVKNEMRERLVKANLGKMSSRRVRMCFNAWAASRERDGIAGGEP
ncbi:unnamed protein product [Vitrella brassicaformis CCMP3155]|uniref:Sfi1 spindle body domain-containing protein n=3 Tax=Vitrella brassicaformis TaxID=1169539 RepID=A0A0G4EF46_VITBC|nr:unnamed protein product [Vitrella brassicaformis CCMP3155]|eukprot:CEL94586.1 unnamed protein product [Vitrella brassicaformis CCMP3155]